MIRANSHEFFHFDSELSIQLGPISLWRVKRPFVYRQRLNVTALA
jgi:hypothetical protein